MSIHAHVLSSHQAKRQRFPQASAETHDTQTANAPSRQHTCTESATVEEPSEDMQRASADIEAPSHTLAVTTSPSGHQQQMQAP